MKIDLFEWFDYPYIAYLICIGYFTILLTIHSNVTYSFIELSLILIYWVILVLNYFDIELFWYWVIFYIELSLSS